MKFLLMAEDEAKAMGDEYVSVEHLFLSLLKHPNAEIKELFAGIRIDAESVFCRLCPQYVATSV